MADNLPDELLLTIFQYLEPADLLKCQCVCESWYPPAHTQILEDVWLKSTCAIEEFIAAIDLEQNQRYLQSVKSIRVLPRDVDNMVLDQKHIDKLVFRFPNLEGVYLDGLGLITNFNENLCRLFLSHCPKLKIFEVNADDEDPRFQPFLKNVQPLLTAIELTTSSHLNTLEAIQLLTRFSRLRTILCKNEALNRLELFFPILEQLPNVTRLFLALNEDMARNYLSTKSQGARGRLTKKVSKIKDLVLFAYNDIGNTLQFIAQYLTGLKILRLERDLGDWEFDEEQDFFCRSLFNLIPSVKVKCSIRLLFMHYTSLVRNFNSLIQNMFQKVPAAYKQSKSRVLEISIRNRCCVPSHLVNLELESRQSPFSRKLMINVDQQFHLSAIAVSLLNGGAPLDEVDVLALRFDNHNSHETPADETPFLDTHGYLDVLETMPSLKQVVLDVPSYYIETAKQVPQYSGPILSLVEEAAFNVSMDRSMQMLLDNCSFTFPNLKRLTIKDSSGVWNASSGEFQLCLSDYTLERLTLDTNPLVKK